MMYRSKIDPRVEEIQLRYRDQDNTQVQKDISYLMMIIRQREWELKTCMKLYDQLWKEKHNEQQG